MLKNMLAAAIVCLPLITTAQTVRIASWNMGWHVSAAEVPNWIERCSSSFVENKSTGRWDLAADGATGSTVGWLVKGDRVTLEGVDLVKMPPCGVYQANGQGVAITREAYAHRGRQLSQYLKDKIRPDVIAFQEVSGTTAVREALGSQADQYHICSFDGEYKIQRLAFAWRKQFGEAAEKCTPHKPVSLPQEAIEIQVRPALTVGLRINGKLVRFMNVHLKSSCVSSLDKGVLDDPKAKHCVILQKQLQPLEAVVEALADGSSPYVVLGDFNRNLWHEQNNAKGSEPVRSDDEKDLTTEWPAGVQSRNLFKEVFDGKPGGAAVLVPLTCSANPAHQALCDAAKTRPLDWKKETLVLANSKALGCRNPIGLDHFVVSSALQSKVKSAEKLPIGALGGTRTPNKDFPQPLLATSDHCPIVLTLEL